MEIRESTWNDFKHFAILMMFRDYARKKPDTFLDSILEEWKKIATEKLESAMGELNYDPIMGALTNGLFGNIKERQKEIDCLIETVKKLVRED